MTLVGGLGTLTGPAVGALVILMLENRLGDLGDGLANLTHIEWFRTLGESVTIVTGVIFILCVLLFRPCSASSARRPSSSMRSPSTLLPA
ncbi:hypothetical protein D3C72_1703100 [compost metagenome]